MTSPEWITRLDLPPENARGRIRRYIEEGYGALLSTFYRAVLSNDLIGAVQGGDAENIAALAAFVEYLTAYAPADCFGSPAKVQDWRGLPDDRG